MTEDRKKWIWDMIASASPIEDISERSRKYRNIIGILSYEATRSDDEWYLEEAIKTASLVTEEQSKACVDIVRAMVKIGLNRKDEKMLARALEITESIDNSLDLSVALHEIAVAPAKLGMDKKDEGFISRSLELIQKIPMDTYVSSAYRNISRSIAGSEPERAKELLGTAIEVIEKSKDVEPVYLASAYCDIASLLVKFNDERSYGFIKKAIALAAGIEDDFGKSAVLLKIVETEIAVGTEKNEEALLREAAKISEGITREYYRSLAQEAIKGRHYSSV